MRKGLLALVIPAFLAGCGGLGWSQGTSQERVTYLSGDYTEKCAVECVEEGLRQEREDLAREKALLRFEEEFDCKLWYDERKMPCWEEGKGVHGMGLDEKYEIPEKTCVKQCVSFYVRD